MCTWSRARSTCTSVGCASISSAMTPIPSSSSPSAEWGTSSYPTRWSHRLVLQFLLPTLAALAGVLVLAVPYVGVTVERHQVDTLVERLLAESRAASEALPWTNGPALDQASARIAAILGVRLTVIAPDGRVLGESTRSSDSLENHADRPEVREAFARGDGHSTRVSATVGTRLLYVAWRQTQGENRRVVRAALPLGAVEENVAHLRRLLVSGIVSAALFGLIVALLLSRGMLRRIQRLVAFARELAAGEPAPYIAPERRDNLGLLESQLGEMARNVAATIAELRVERERLEAMLRGMGEGVVVTELEGRVVLMNSRARELLGTPPDLDGRGRDRKSTRLNSSH